MNVHEKVNVSVVIVAMSAPHSRTHDNSDAFTLSQSHRVAEEAGRDF